MSAQICQIQSDRFACTTQICVVRCGLSDGKITISYCLLAFFSAIFLAVVRLLSLQSMSLAKYWFQVAPSIKYYNSMLYIICIILCTVFCINDDEN